MSRLLFVRHGQSEWNAVGRWQGQADPSLTDLGRRQAVAAVARLGVVDVVVSSPLRRAVETAAVFAEHLGVGPVLVEHDLQERDAGPWTGLTRGEIEERWPGHLDNGERPPGYESDVLVTQRVTASVERLAVELGDGTAIIVTHAGVIYAIEAEAGLPFERVPNLGARWVEVGAEGVIPGDRLDLLAGSDVLATIPDHL